MSDRLDDFLADNFQPEMIDQLQEIVDAIGEELGESPEAWRGVGLMCQFIAVVGIGCSENEVTDTAKALTTIGLVCCLLRRHPAVIAMRGRP